VTCIISPASRPPCFACSRRARPFAGDREMAPCSHPRWEGNAMAVIVLAFAVGAVFVMWEHGDRQR
jgi:hypothetical protein